MKRIMPILLVLLGGCASQPHPFDLDGDGQVLPSELNASLLAQYPEFDKNDDGYLDAAERNAILVWISQGAVAPRSITPPELRELNDLKLRNKLLTEQVIEANLVRLRLKAYDYEGR